MKYVHYFKVHFLLLELIIFLCTSFALSPTWQRTLEIDQYWKLKYTSKKFELHIYIKKRVFFKLWIVVSYHPILFDHQQFHLKQLWGPLQNGHHLTYQFHTFKSFEFKSKSKFKLIIIQFEFLTFILVI